MGTLKQQLTVKTLRRSGSTGGFLKLGRWRELANATLRHVLFVVSQMGIFLRHALKFI
jgi:hypothetical protein